MYHFIVYFSLGRAGFDLRDDIAADTKDQAIAIAVELRNSSLCTVANARACLVG